MDEQNEIIWKLIDTYEREILQVFFPKAKFKSKEFSTSNELRATTFKGLISSEGLFENTDYKFNPDSHFIHFTSLPVLSQILKSGFLRMSDFNCLSDKSELHFAQSVFFDWDDDELKKIKANIFSLSACLSSSETLYNHHLWEKYACKGMGCIIEYKFISTDIHQMNFGRVLYGRERLKSLYKLKKLNAKFKNDYDFNITDMPLLLLRVSAFHKKMKFKNEQEVRLLFYNDTGYPKGFTHRNYYPDIYSDQQVRNFIKLYIKGKNSFNKESNSDYEKNLKFEPEIEISRVIIGPNNPTPFEVADHLIQLREEYKVQFDICYFDKTIRTINRMMPSRT